MNKSVIPTILVLVVLRFLPVVAQSPEFKEPWKNPNVALAIDPFEGNDIDWDKLATDKRVVAIIHRATIGNRVDQKYAERKIEAKKRGYKWGAYHVGKPGNGLTQADFFLETVKPDADDLLALDLESTDSEKYMSFEDARVFVSRIKENTGHYPIIYANNFVIHAINQQAFEDDVLARTLLWYARFKSTVTDFPKGLWTTYTFWQFSSEINCLPNNRDACLYTVPGTAYDMDVNVFNGTVEELKRKWPLNIR
jgi:GH25 family lysozyme M1 (1,4-beta-N-acetylmuramidase)